MDVVIRQIVEEIKQDIIEACELKLDELIHKYDRELEEINNKLDTLVMYARFDNLADEDARPFGYLRRDWTDGGDTKKIWNLILESKTKRKPQFRPSRPLKYISITPCRTRKINPSPVPNLAKIFVSPAVSANIRFSSSLGPSITCNFIRYRLKSRMLVVVRGMQVEIVKWIEY
uniref:Uncharacterized protein n=1 Tax=Nicotiana tabacum TaxID=4097 RepID=A0A1S4ARF5_TOBAC|nr:PREDICTED: uncharacterized protein LOC107800425 [Nicotiana tabacum]